jgi:hypothetical protein
MTIPIPAFTHFFRAAAAVLLSAGLLSATLGVLASATPDQLATPSPTATAPAPHEFYGVTPVPPPMPKAVVIAKEAGR